MVVVRGEDFKAKGEGKGTARGEGRGDWVVPGEDKTGLGLTKCTGLGLCARLSAESE